MTSPKWSIEGELRKLTGEASAPAALARLGLIGSPMARHRLREIQGWGRSGSETYSYVFSVQEDGGLEAVCRLKACVAFSGGGSVDAILDSWLARRASLSATGASTPHLYAAGGGVLLEEEIPLDMVSAMAGPNRESVLASLLDIASAIVKLGFAPTSAFSDVRSRGADAVFIDFGSDLGAALSRRGSEDQIFRQLTDQLKRWRVELSAEEEAHLRDAFNARVASFIQ